MGRQVASALYVVAMAAVIVGVDFVFLRNRFWERLTVNIGIVLGVRSVLREIHEASMRAGGCPILRALAKGGWKPLTLPPDSNLLVI